VRPPADRGERTLEEDERRRPIAAAGAFKDVDGRVVGRYGGAVCKLSLRVLLAGHGASSRCSPHGPALVVARPFDLSETGRRVAHHRAEPR
jgi:hypothetical protein